MGTYLPSQQKHSVTKDLDGFEKDLPSMSCSLSFVPWERFKGYFRILTMKPLFYFPRVR
jgi:hypothetical protein